MKGLIMRRMKMLAIDADLQHCILSDVLSCHPWAFKFWFFSREGYPKTLLQAHIQKTPENVSSEPKLKILRRFWMRKWPVLSRFRSFQILLSPFLIFLLQLLTQPRSQGLSSYCPLGQAKRDPGWVWSHATLTIENIREGSSVIRQFVMLSFVKALRCDCHF